MLCNDLNAKEIQKRGVICICIAESPNVSVLAETNTTLYTQKKKNHSLHDTLSLSPVKLFLTNLQCFHTVHPSYSTDYRHLKAYPSSQLRASPWHGNVMKSSLIPRCPERTGKSTTVFGLPVILKMLYYELQYSPKHGSPIFKTQETSVIIWSMGFRIHMDLGPSANSITPRRVTSGGSGFKLSLLRAQGSTPGWGTKIPLPCALAKKREEGVRWQNVTTSWEAQPKK